MVHCCVALGGKLPMACFPSGIWHLYCHTYFQNLSILQCPTFAKQESLYGSILLLSTFNIVYGFNPCSPID
uniref:Uncharacterized protein n=1 Tax=Arundo donax TaxID=35708 RepID=A0A0A9HME0_ARUDO